MSQIQLNLFNSNIDIDGVDSSEAPFGFIAISKKRVNVSNVCDCCDARQLCQKNEDDWCLINRCMGYSITAFKDGKTYSRNDGQSVIFKRA